MKNHYCGTRTYAEKMQANPIDSRSIATDTDAGGELDDFSPALRRKRSDLRGQNRRVSKNCKSHLVSRHTSLDASIRELERNLTIGLIIVPAKKPRVA